MTIQWKDATSVGDATLDRQHKNLMDKLNTFLELENYDAKKMAGMLDFIKEHALIHFDYEEKYMTVHKFPELKEHKMLHAEFLKDFTDRLDNVTNKKTPESVEELKQYLQTWWDAHVMDADQRYEAYINSHPESHPDNEAPDYHTQIHG